MRYRQILLLVLILGLSIGGVIRAQDAAPVDVPTEVPTDIPTEIPTEVATDVPTEVPTEVATNTPTDVPTEVATEVATEVPSDVPTEVATEETPTLEPTVAVNLPPQFSLDGSLALDATAGLQTTFTLAVADEDGLVTVGRADTTSPASIIVTQAAEAVAADPRFYTAVTVDYTAPADFVGADSFTLVAVDAANLSTTLTLTVNVVPPVEITPEATLEPTPEPTALPDEVRILHYDPAASEKSIQAMLSVLGAIEVSRIPQIGAMKVQIPQGFSTTVAGMSAMSVNTTARAAGVISIEPDIIYQTAAFPNDTLYPPTGGASTSNQWALTETSDGSMAVNFAWGISVKDGTGVTVAVLDTGIDTTHPDLVGKLLPGWDFVNDDNNTDDDNGHGTQVAGIIAANTNNAKGIAGIAYNAKLLPVKVCNLANICSAYDIAAGMVFATDKGAKVANLSIAGATKSTTLEAAVQYAISRNMTIIAAAGNCGDAANPCPGIAPTDYMYPASYPGVISVAAHDIDGNHAPFSQISDGDPEIEGVTVSAPGVSIVSTIALDHDPDAGTADGYYIESLDGTSMAAANVTGVVALMLSDKVVSTPAGAREALICSAYDPSGTGHTPEFGYGLVQADLAQNWNGNSGYLCKPTVPNDFYQNATNIPSVPFTTTLAVDERTVTHSSSDPFDTTNAGLYSCGQGDRTVWYKFKPTVSDYYQITTLGSSYDTDLSVWQLPEEGNTSTNFIACNDQSPEGYSDASYLNAPLTAGQTYYIMVSNYNDGVNPVSPMSDSLLVLDVRRAMFNNNVDYQENSPNIYYLGSWVQTPTAGAAGGSVKSTTDLDAIAVFTFRGVALDIARTIGPTQDDMVLLVDGFPYPIFNKGVILKRNQVEHIPLCVCNTPGLWHQAVLTRIGGPGSIDIDRIRTFEADMLPTASITALTDDSLGSSYPCAAKKFCYTGVGAIFTSMPRTGANLGKVTQTMDADATISFRATGSTITIFRTTGPGYGTMDVQVDGILVGDDVSNDSGAIHAKVPYVISGLGAYSHVVQIINNTGGTLEFDAAQASTPAPIAATPAVLTNENAATLLYGGYWTNVAFPGAVGNTIRQTDEIGASVSFKYTGNFFTIGYQKTVADVTVDVYVDNQLITPAPAHLILPGGADGTPATLDSKTILGLQSDRTHTVQIVLVSGTFKIDSVGARRQAIITPSMGLVQETNAAVSYDTSSDPWSITTAKSLGNYMFQGGKAKRATNLGANLSFYANGTGFILYTSVGPTQDAWEVYVDGVLFPDLTLAGAPINYIDLHTVLRFRPLAYAITGLDPGIHKITLKKLNGTGSVDFDAVRVFP